MRLLGLDIGSSYLKYALRKGRRIVRCGRIRLTADTLRSSHDERMKNLQAAAFSMMRELALKHVKAAVSLSGFMTRTQVTALPSVSGSQLDDVLYHETQALCPHGDMDVLYNYALVPESDNGPRYGVSCLAREAEVEESLAILSSAGIEPVRVEFGPLVYANLPELREAAGLMGALEIGAKTTAMTICRDGGLIACLHVPLGCEEALRSLEKNTGCDREDALAALRWWLYEEQAAADHASAAPEPGKNTTSVEPAQNTSGIVSESSERGDCAAENSVSFPATGPQADEIDQFFSDEATQKAPEEYVLVDDDPPAALHVSPSNTAENLPDQAAQLQAHAAEDLCLEEIEAPVEETPDEEVVELGLSDYEVGSDSAQEAELQAFLAPAAPLPPEPQPEPSGALRSAAAECFPATFHRLLTLLHRSLFPLRENEGIQLSDLHLRLAGFCAASPRLAGMVKDGLAVAEARPLELARLPEDADVPQALQIACGLALAGAYAPEGTPDMLPPQLAERNEKKRLLLLRAACVLIALLPLPGLIQKVIQYRQQRMEVTALEAAQQQREGELVQEKALQEKTIAQQAQYKSLLEFADARERFFTVLPAFNSLGREKIWLGEITLINDDATAGRCRLQGWSFDALDAFVKQLRESKLCGEISLTSSNAGAASEKTGMVVGDIEGGRKGEKFVEAEMLFSGGSQP